MISVETIDSIELFNKCRDNWEKVYRQDNEAEYFLSWGWLSQLYELRNESVFILAVKMSASSSGYCAFFPLRREVRLSSSRQQFFNSYSMAGNYWADSTGIICDPSFENSAIPALAHALKTFSWQRILFESLKISSRRKSWLTEPFSKQNYSIRSKTHLDNQGKTDLTKCPFIELPESLEAYLEHNISSNTRQKFRRIRRKIDSEPCLSIELATPATIEQHLVFFEKAWIENWVGVKGHSAKRLASKYSEFIRKGTQSDDMLVPVLLHESEPVGMLACYKDPVKKQLLFFVAGRNAKFDKISGGHALHMFCIEWAIDNGYKQYKLLRGDEPYKYSLGGTDALLSNLEVFKREPSPSAQILHSDVKTPALSILKKHRGSFSNATVHQLYSQLLESWPNDLEVLTHYAGWLESIGQSDHANDIGQFLNSVNRGEVNSLDVKRSVLKVDIAPFNEMRQWLDDLRDKIKFQSAIGTMNIKGLRLEIVSSDPQYFDWLAIYLNPLVTSAEIEVGNVNRNDSDTTGGSNQGARNVSNYRLVCMNENLLIERIMRLIKSDAFEIESFKLGGRKIQRVYVTSDLSIDVCRQAGVVWVSDNASKQLSVLISSRANWPSLEVSRTARALITGYLQQEGWIFLHSGAARIENKNYLVIGNAGDGKTSLLLALMSVDCQYISNERVFVRKVNNEIEALSFPMPVAIGLGTAQQYPEIMQYVYNPEYCLYPSRRLKINNLRATPESKWSTLSDKIQLLVPELTAHFGRGEALQGGPVSGVIVPLIVRECDVDFRDNVTHLNKKELKKIVNRNHIATERDTRYPAWLPLAFHTAPGDAADQLIDSICALEGIRFEYCVSKDRKEAVVGYPGIISDAFG